MVRSSRDNVLKLAGGALCVGRDVDVQASANIPPRLHDRRPRTPPDRLHFHFGRIASKVLLAYTLPDTSFHDEQTEDRTKQVCKASATPELRIISPVGAELAAISLTDFHTWGCNDYVLADVSGRNGEASEADNAMSR
ncbi:hypothetical protein B0H11DRAFT_2266329 [Mycena galericulata]|nr:hypothetical protein B0H11DRAFT_2266329 [Mycena galericulata]